MSFRPSDAVSIARATVLVVGAAGFIGRWVARSLSGRTGRLCLLVREQAAARPILSRWGIDGEVVEADLLDAGAIRHIVGRFRPAVTFNLAGYGVDPAQRDAHIAYRINAEFVESLCEALAENELPAWSGVQLVNVGSALEYGSIAGDLREASSPDPTTLYGRSKLAGTRALARCCRARGLRGITARLFTVYGPGEHPSRLLPSLHAAARRSGRIPLTAGLQRRDFTYVEDVAEGLLRLALAPAEPGEVVNLATGRLHSVREFIETAAPIVGLADAQLDFGALPTRAEEMAHDPVNIRRLDELIGWRPQTDIGAGIRRTCSW